MTVISGIGYRLDGTRNKKKKVGNGDRSIRHSFLRERATPFYPTNRFHGQNAVRNHLGPRL